MITLESKYPILCTPMNQVSDINLAIAVHHSGAYPSLSIFNYENRNGSIDYKSLDRDLIKFKNETGTNSLLISMSANNLVYDRELLEILVENQLLNIELLDNVNYVTIPLIQKIRKDLKKKNFRLFIKEIAARLIMEVDVLILKGPEGAGRSLKGGPNLKNLFYQMKSSFPNLPLIPTGGIGNKDEIDFFIKQGAVAVGVGTLFAASAESPLSFETKMKMVEASSLNLMKFEKVNQNALIFRKIDQDDENNTRSLKIGITDPSQGGHVFAGVSIDNINSIKPVKEIVEDLIKGLYDN